MDFGDSFYQFKILSRHSIEPIGYHQIRDPQPGALARYLIAKADANPVFEQILHTFCPKTEDLINPYDTDLDEAYLKELTFRLAACTVWYRKSGQPATPVTHSLFDNEPQRGIGLPNSSRLTTDHLTPPWATSSGGGGGGEASASNQENQQNTNANTHDYETDSIRAHMEQMRRISAISSPSIKPSPIASSKKAANPLTDWLEINLYYADQHQTPVFDHPYMVTLPDGSVRKGNLNKNGFARIDGIPKGNAKVEIKGDPAQKAKLRKLHDQLEVTLNQLVQQAASDTKAQKQANHDTNSIEEGLVYVGAFMMGGVDIVTDLWAFAKIVGQGLVKAELAYLDLLEDFFRGDARAIQRKLEKAKETGIGAYQGASEAAEAIYLLVSDPDSWEILTNFVEDYWEASSGVDLTRSTAPVVIEILITILTAGAGSPVLAANLGKAASLTDDAVEITQQIVKVHKAVGQKIEKPTGTNTQVVIPIKKEINTNKSTTPDWESVKKAQPTEAKGKLDLKKKPKKQEETPPDTELLQQLDNIEGLSEKQRQQILDAQKRGKSFEGDFQGGSKGNWNKDLNKDLKPNAVYRVNGYLYETDDIGRIVKVSGKLKLEKADRNKYQQSKAGEENGIKDGLADDEGGHLIASLFKGAGEQINYAAMDGNFNKGHWKKMENRWAKALKSKPPKEVEVNISPIYEGNSKRPSKFEVEYFIDGNRKRSLMDNKSSKQD